MRVLVSGSHGLVGSALVNSLRQEGHTVVRLVRRLPSTAEGESFVWDPVRGDLDPAKLRGLDCIVHLAGENIAAGRWTEDKKRRIRDSRVRDTRLLAKTVAELEQWPPVFLCASAVGYYGDRGDEVLDESASPGEGFLADVCRQWEAATDPAREVTRVVNMRLGAVLSPEGGMLAAMLPLYRYGLGAPLGSGRQFISWIHRDDLIRAVHFIVETPSIIGPVNLVSPHPVTNADFTRSLHQRIERPWMQWLKPLRRNVPRLVLEPMVGEMAKEMLLASTCAVPSVLQSEDFAFRYPDLDAALASFRL